MSTGVGLVVLAVVLAARVVLAFIWRRRRRRITVRVDVDDYDPDADKKG